MTRGPQRAVKRADVLDTMKTGVVYTAGSLAQHFDASKDTTYHRLRELGSLDKINTKQTGGRARIWWKPHAQSIDTSFIEEMSFRSDIDPDILATLAQYNEQTEPLTSGELSDLLNSPQDSIYSRLKRLESENLVKSAKVGGNSVVWWLFTADIKAEA